MVEEIEINKIYNCDCIDGLKKLNNDTIDLIITSPPYNINEDYDEYEDNRDDYIKWCDKWLKECYRVLKNDGRFCLNIGNRLNEDKNTYMKIIDLCLIIGFNIYDTLIWHQKDKYNSTAWGSFKSASCPCFISDYEFIIIFYKNSKKKILKGENDISEEEFREWIHSIWEINTEKKTEKVKSSFNKEFPIHPTTFPIYLPYRLIKLLSFKGDIILDHFMGTGTTACAAKLLGRKYIGFEKNEKYVDLSQYRLDTLIDNKKRHDSFLKIHHAPGYRSKYKPDKTVKPKHSKIDKFL